MQWLNYHHLLYFRTVAKEGGLAPAAAKLRLSPPTISAQIHALERSMGEKLFEKRGRKLALTEVGRVVLGYADEIFTLGRELVDTVQGQPTGRPLRFVVGISDSIPKLIARRLLLPAQELEQSIQLVCREDHPERLLADLALHSLDVVLADEPASAKPGASVRVFSHPLGECGVSFFAQRALCKRLKPAFPKSLDGAPVLLPSESSALRRQLDQWFDRQGVRPQLVAEFDDSALLKAFAQDGLGFFASADVIAKELAAQYGLTRLGVAKGLKERFYAITAERKLRHPAVMAISAGARRDVFGA